MRDIKQEYLWLVGELEKKFGKQSVKIWTKDYGNGLYIIVKNEKKTANLRIEEELFFYGVPFILSLNKLPISDKEKLQVVLDECNKCFG